MKEIYVFINKFNILNLYLIGLHYICQEPGQTMLEKKIKRFNWKAVISVSAQSEIFSAERFSQRL